MAIEEEERRTVSLEQLVMIEVSGRRGKGKGIYIRNLSFEIIHLLKRMTIELKKIQFLWHRVSTEYCTRCTP